MARVNVYLPDRLAQEVRAAGMNLSEVTQGAVQRELTLTRLSFWLDRIALERAMYVPPEVGFEETLKVAAPDLIGGGARTATLGLGRPE